MKVLASKRKQIVLVVSLSILYFVHVIGRTSVAANLLNFQKDYGIVKSTASLIISLFSFAYGAGQIINSFFIKKYNKRMSVFIPVLLESICLFLLFLRLPFVTYNFIWLAGGIFYSFFWMSIMKILSENLEDKLLSKASVILSVMNGLGSAFGYLLSSAFTALNVYRIVFLVSAILILLFDINFLLLSKHFKCSPKEYDDKENKTNMYEKVEKPKYLFLFMIAFMVFTPIAAIGTGSIKNWTPNILEESFGLVSSLAIFFAVVVPIVHCFCSILVVTLRKFNLKFQQIISGLMFIVIVSFVMILVSFKTKATALYIIFAAVGYFGFGCINTTTTNLLSLQMRSYYDSGMFSGIVNGSAYVGEVIAAYGVALYVEHTSWSSLYILLIILTSFVAISSLLLYIFFRKKKEYQPFL